MILAGQGVIQSGATKELLTFAERIDAPIAMTLLGLGGVPASHPLNLGMMGMHGEAWVNHAIQEADLLLAFGMRFDDRVTGNIKTYAPHAKKIHVDIDPSEINKNVVADAAIVGDLRETLADFLDVLEPEDHAPWLAYIDSMKGDAAVRDIQKLPDTGHLYAAHVINDIWRITGGNAVVVTDVGQHQMWEAQYYHHETPRSLITSGGLGTMGFAVPAAIGAKIARPDAEVWAIVGDGGFQMTQAELTTAAQEGLKINIAIINNGYLGHGAAVAGVLLRTPLRGDTAAKPRLREDCRGARSGRASRRKAERSDRHRRARPRSWKARSSSTSEWSRRTACIPMVPAGADLHAMIRRPDRSVLAETGRCDLASPIGVLDSDRS